MNKNESSWNPFLQFRNDWNTQITNLSKLSTQIHLINSCPQFTQPLVQHIWVKKIKNGNLILAAWQWMSCHPGISEPIESGEPKSSKTFEPCKSSKLVNLVNLVILLMLIIVAIIEKAVIQVIQVIQVKLSESIGPSEPIEKLADWVKSVKLYMNPVISNKSTKWICDSSDNRDDSDSTWCDTVARGCTKSKHLVLYTCIGVCWNKKCLSGQTHTYEQTWIWYTWEICSMVLSQFFLLNNLISSYLSGEKSPQSTF